MFQHLSSMIVGEFETLALKSHPRIRFAGQITGCEGYVESAAVGLIAGRFAAAEKHGGHLVPPPETTALDHGLGFDHGLVSLEDRQPGEAEVRARLAPHTIPRPPPQPRPWGPSPGRPAEPAGGRASF